MKHECPGLRACLDHPRWHVIRSISGRFYVYGPDAFPDRALDTFEEAINYAQQGAERDAQKKSRDTVREQARQFGENLSEDEREMYETRFTQAEQRGREIMAHGTVTRNET